MTDCKKCTRYRSDCAGTEGVVCTGFDQKPITNADRIRSMSDEELAHVLCLTAKNGIIGQRSETEWLAWLKREAE